MDTGHAVKDTLLAHGILIARQAVRMAVIADDEFALEFAVDLELGHHGLNMVVARLGLMSIPIKLFEHRDG